MVVRSGPHAAPHMGASMYPKRDRLSRTKSEHPAVGCEPPASFRPAVRSTGERHAAARPCLPLARGKSAGKNLRRFRALSADAHACHTPAGRLSRSGCVMKSKPQAVSCADRPFRRGRATKVPTPERPAAAILGAWPLSHTTRDRLGGGFRPFGSRSLPGDCPARRGPGPRRRFPSEAARPFAPKVDPGRDENALRAGLFLRVAAASHGAEGHSVAQGLSWAGRSCPRRAGRTPLRPSRPRRA
jgi:hypothetical protein